MSFLLLQFPVRLFPVFLSFPSADHVALQPMTESYVLSEALDFVIVYRELMFNSLCARRELGLSAFSC